jgi:transcription antitermination factor NusG
MAYWAAARLQPRHEALALHCLALAGYETYLPRLRERRVSRGRRITVTPPLFPGYCFVLIQLQWHSARWAPGVATVILNGASPARSPTR